MWLNPNSSFLGRCRVNQRYSIENYIFDPILLAIFLLREKFLQKEIVGLKDQEIYSDIRSFCNDRLQEIANYVVGELAKKSNGHHSKTYATCKYVGGSEVQLPTWVLHQQGHDLERNIKEVFPHLKRYQGEFSLKQEILNKVIDDLPELLPLDFLSLFKEIQNS